MKPEDFDELVTARFGFCARTLQLKGSEYSTNTDRLHNFKIAAAFQGCEPESALLGMWAKHLVSIRDIVDGIEAGRLPDEKMLSEKITDSINYLVLLEALFLERMGE